jgi:hypothetical protein
MKYIFLFVAFLIAQGAVSLEIEEDILRQIDFLNALNSHNLQEVAELVDSGVDPNVDVNDRPALITMIEERRFDIASYLAKSPLLKVSEQFLLAACDAEDPNLLRMLLEAPDRFVESRYTQAGSPPITFKVFEKASQKGPAFVNVLLRAEPNSNGIAYHLEAVYAAVAQDPSLMGLWQDKDNTTHRQIVRGIGQLCILMGNPRFLEDLLTDDQFNSDEKNDLIIYSINFRKDYFCSVLLGHYSEQEWLAQNKDYIYSILKNSHDENMYLAFAEFKRLGNINDLFLAELQQDEPSIKVLEVLLDNGAKPNLNKIDEELSAKISNNDELRVLLWNSNIGFRAGPIRDDLAFDPEQHEDGTDVGNSSAVSDSLVGPPGMPMSFSVAQFSPMESMQKPFDVTYYCQNSDEEDQWWNADY